MKDKLVSIIVPVYNVEGYIAECLESILEQSYKNIEIIVIDDGSTDNSAFICKEYAKKDSRLQFYQQENKGVVLARKLAVAYAKGEYIGFVDADDFIESDMYERLMENIDSCNLVISAYYDEKSQSKIFEVIPKGKYSTKIQIEYLLSNMIIMQDDENARCRGISPYVWNKLYEKKLVDEVFEEVNLNTFLGEDAEFVYCYLLKCRSVFITNYCGYHYRMRRNSTIHAIHENYLKNLNGLYHSLHIIFSKHIMHKRLIKQLEIWISREIIRAGILMGFQLENRNIVYIFPLIKEVIGKNIILYGAGQVGQDYKKLLEQINICNLVFWVDKNYKQYSLNNNISSVEEGLVMQFDYIVLAVLKKELAENMRSELLTKGVEEKKILWKPPIW